MSDTLGTIRGQMILDVKQAMASYTAVRQANVSTVTALHAGAGAIASSGAIIAGAGIAMAAGIINAVDAAAQFEKRLDYFAAVSNATQEQYEAISAKALQLGADTSFTANQVAEAFVELGKAGVGTQDILDGIGEAVTNIGAAAEIPLDTAAQIITSALATFNLGADQAIMVADKLAGAANSSILDVEDLGVSLKYVGGIASSLSVPFNDVNTALAIMGEAGIKGSTAGTSLRQVLLGLNGSTDKAKGALEELGIITEDGGNKFFTAEGKAKSLADIFQILQDATAGYTDQQRTATLQQIFAVRSLPSLIALMEAGAEGFESFSAAIDSTTAAEVAAARLDNLAGDIEKFKGALDSANVTVGQNFQGAARFFVQAATSIIDAFTALPAGVQIAFSAFGSIVSIILIAVGFAGLFAGAILNMIALSQVLAPALSFLAGGYRAVAGGILAMNAALASNPLALVLVIIATIVGALIALYAASETFRNAVQPLFDALLGVFATLQPVIQNVLGVLAQFFSSLASGAAGVGTGLITTLASIATTIGGVLSGALATIIPPLLAFVQVLAAGVMPVITALMPLITTFAQIFAALFSGNLEALPGLIATAASQFSTLISTIATTLIPMVISILTNIIVAIIGMLPVLVEAAVTLFTGLVTAVATVLPMVIGAIVQTVTGLITAIIGILPDLITAALGLVLAIIQALVTMLPALIQGAISLFTGLLTGVLQVLPVLINAIVTIIPILIQALVTALPLIITSAIQLFTGLITGLLTALPLIITALVQAIPLILTTIVEAVPLLIEAAITLFVGIITALATALPQIIIALVEAIPLIITALVDAIPLIIEAAIQLFLGIITGLLDAFPQIIDALIVAIPQIIDALIQAVPKLIDAGRQLIEGLINGIGQMGSALWDAATNIANKALDAIKSFFGIKSPSRLFAQMGVYLIEGLMVGMDNTERALVNTVESIASAISDIPFELSGMEALYDSIAITKDLALTGSGLSDTDRQIARAEQAKSNKATKEVRQGPLFEVNQYNPVSRSPFKDAIEAGDMIISSGLLPT